MEVKKLFVSITNRDNWTTKIDFSFELGNLTVQFYLFNFFSRVFTTVSTAMTMIILT